MARIALLSAAALSACGPMSPEAVQRQCEARARSAAGPTGSVGLGFGSGGTATSVDIRLSSDFLTGRDPQGVYDDCLSGRTQVGAAVEVER